MKWQHLETETAGTCSSRLSGLYSKQTAGDVQNKWNARVAIIQFLLLSPAWHSSLVRKTEHRNTIQHWHPVTDIALQPRGGSFSDGDSVFKLHLRSIFIWAPCACIHYTHILLVSGGSGMCRSMTPPHLMPVCHLISLLRSPARDHLHEEQRGHVTIAHTRY